MIKQLYKFYGCEVAMITTEINKMLESFNHLQTDEKEYVTDIINKQLAEIRREQIFQRAIEAKSNLKQGLVKTGSVQELYKDLEED